MQNQEHQDYNFIEYFLNLLPVLELNSQNAGALMQHGGQFSASALPEDANSFRLAYEIMNFMDEMPGGFFIYRADGDEELIYANKALLRIFQCETLKEFREWTNNSFKGLVHPDDLDVVEQSIAEQISASQFDLDYVEYRIVRKDGEIRWIEDYGHFTRTKSVGDFFYVFAADATEKRRRQIAEKTILIQEKQQKEEKLRSLIEQHAKERTLIDQEHLRRLEVIEGLSMNYESILYADLNANTILPYRLSTRTERQFGKKLQMRSFDWYTHDYVDTWVHPEDRKIVAAATSPAYIRQQLAAHNSYFTNYRIINDDEVQYLQLRIVNVGNQEHISQIIMGYRRVDEEFRREMEQKQMLEEALANANLAMVAKNTFLSNMSHDMRTPLNAIFGYTALARKNAHDTAAVEDYLGKIETSGRQLLELINQVLEISWTESNDAKLEESECSLQDILHDVHKLLLPQAEEKAITFSLEMTNLEQSSVYCDTDRLKQLLQNLVNNAITYTNTGGHVELTAAELEPLPNHYRSYRFTVQDSGIGISPDFLAHIYEPFEREKNTTCSGIHGTGLGLTITKSIVEKMGGTIDVASTVGSGSTFTVTLPFRVQEQPQPSSVTSTTDVFTQLLHQKILLVEDNEINLEIETELLQDLGLQIEPAKNGKIAVEIIKNSEPGAFGLILMDIQMPVMNGWEAAKAIRSLADPTLSTIPIIALSANAFDSDKRTSKESGINAHLTKPFDVPLLLETIGKIIS